MVGGENCKSHSLHGLHNTAFIPNPNTATAGNPDKKELEEITTLWQTSLFNNHIEIQRYVIDEARAIFMFNDGSKAYDALEYLLKQDRCAEVTIDGKAYPGKGAGSKKNDEKKSEL